MRFRVRTAAAAASGDRHRAIPTFFPASLTFEKMPLPAVSVTSPFLGDGVARPEDNTSAYWNRMAAARELRTPDTFQAYDVRIPDLAQDQHQIYDVLHSNLTKFARQGERVRASANVVKAREILMKRMAYRAYGILTADELTELSQVAKLEPEIARYFGSLADAMNSSMLMPPLP